MREKKSEKVLMKKTQREKVNIDEDNDCLIESSETDNNNEVKMDKIIK